MELAKANKISDPKGHLAWLYTWPASRGVAYCTIGGKAFDPSVALPKIA
jgi:hypothetical protein